MPPPSPTSPYLVGTDNKALLHAISTYQVEAIAHATVNRYNLSLGRTGDACINLHFNANFVHGKQTINCVGNSHLKFLSYLTQ
jgi:hypothetical protein